MEGILEEHEFTYGAGKKLFFLAAGHHDGPLIIFCHGWPAIGKTWKAQLEALAALGFRVIAPDMPGYGQSSAVRDIQDYSLESVNQGMTALLAHLEREKAIWIGHDWGAVAVWAFVAHYPEKATAAVGLARPYHTLELGLEEVIKTVNRDIYPIEQFPNGQYDYQVYFEQSFDQATAWFDKDPAGVLRAIYRKGDPSEMGKPALTATITKAGGWFGGAPQPPPQLRQIPDEALCIDADVLAENIKAIEKTGFWSPNAWYLNHQQNRDYTLDKRKQGGRLEMPVLFIGAKFDPISDVATSTIAQSQKQYCTSLTEKIVDTGHWPALEMPDEVNTLIIEWLRESVSKTWAARQQLGGFDTQLINDG